MPREFHECALVAEDLDIMSEVDLTLRSEDGITFFKVQDVQVNFTIGKLRLRLKNLYNGLKALGRFLSTRRAVAARAVCTGDRPARNWNIAS